jgi:glutathione S-transferase
VAAALAARGGPFLLGGAAPMLPDLMLWPFIERLCVVQHFRGYTLPEEPRFAPLRAWEAAMRARESVAATSNDIAFFAPHYAKYVV